MFQFRNSFAFKFANNALRQNFSKFNAPLIERINVPNCALRKDTLFVKRDEFAEHFRRQFFRENCVRWTIAFKHAMRHE